VVEGNPSGEGRAGAFEVSGPGGTLLFSRLASNTWPSQEGVVRAISAVAEAAAAAGGGSEAAACSLPGAVRIKV
jgi:hypothetical protein